MKPSLIPSTPAPPRPTSKACSKACIKSLINDNLQLKDRVRKLEIELAEDQQYQRRSNIVISGTPSSIKDENVESTVVDILNKIDVPVPPRDIQAAHRIGRDKE